jgi:hypothetical protein
VAVDKNAEALLDRFRHEPNLPQKRAEDMKMLGAIRDLEWMLAFRFRDYLPPAR